MNQAQSSHEQPTGLCRGETFLFYRAASILNLRKLPLQKHSQLDIITAEILFFPRRQYLVSGKKFAKQSTFVPTKY